MTFESALIQNIFHLILNSHLKKTGLFSYVVTAVPINTVFYKQNTTISCHSKLFIHVTSMNNEYSSPNVEEL